MKNFQLLFSAKQCAAAADQRLADARARLSAIENEASNLEASKPSTVGAMTKVLDRQNALRVERRRADAEHVAATAVKERAARHLASAEVIAERAAFEQRCAETATKLWSEYAPLADGIVALMATSRRLHMLLKERRAFMQPPIPEILISPEFCAMLRLPNNGPGGPGNYFWYPGDPSQIEAIKTADAVPLDEIRAGAKDEVADAARGAAKAIAAGYEDRAQKIISLLRAELALEPAIHEMNRKTARLFPVISQLSGLTGGRFPMLSRAIRLPDATGRRAPLWRP